MGRVGALNLSRPEVLSQYVLRVQELIGPFDTWHNCHRGGCRQHDLQRESHDQELQVRALALGVLQLAAFSMVRRHLGQAHAPKHTKQLGLDPSCFPKCIPQGRDFSSQNQKQRHCHVAPGHCHVAPGQGNLPTCRQTRTDGKLHMLQCNSFAADLMRVITARPAPMPAQTVVVGFWDYVD